MLAMFLRFLCMLVLVLALMVLRNNLFQLYLGAGDGRSGWIEDRAADERGMLCASQHDRFDPGLFSRLDLLEGLQRSALKALGVKAHRILVGFQINRVGA